MRLEKFLSCYGGHACISIAGYCEEERYDYYSVPEWIEDERDIEEFIKELSSVYILDDFFQPCLFLEPWWAEIKDREIERWGILTGGKRAELSIRLKEGVECSIAEKGCAEYNGTKKAKARDEQSLIVLDMAIEIAEKIREALEKQKAVSALTKAPHKCPVCGNELEPEYKSCIYCGHLL